MEQYSEKNDEMQNDLRSELKVLSIEKEKLQKELLKLSTTVS